MSGAEPFALLRAEELALLHALDTLPPTADPAFREHLIRAVRKVLGVSWVGTVRHYYLDVPWHYDRTAGLWIKTPGDPPMRAHVECFRPMHCRKSPALELWGPADFPDTLYVVSAGYDDPQIMRLPIAPRPAEPCTDANLFLVE